MSSFTCHGFLLRLPAGSQSAFSAAPKSRSFIAAGTKFEIEPLSPRPTQGLGVAQASEWHVARAVSGSISAGAWQIAHAEIAGTRLGIDARPEFVEPDFVQSWPFERPATSNALRVNKGDGVFDDQADGLPRRPGRFAWHLDDEFTQLRRARERAASAGRAVRIAHFDTGYDPDHRTFPGARVETDLQRNFVDADRPRDARDRGFKGVLKNPGHGTGTLGILAGGRFAFSDSTLGYRFDEAIGGAPEARIVPVRVGNSVVQISTSSVARAFEYVTDLCGSPTTRIHVVSMSMGGVASEAWADAVNHAYEAGIVIVTAAGNNFSAGLFGVPTHFIVYPARFRRVIAACGLMADRRPYYGLSIGTMQGNWGPDSKMGTALSAFTPNTPWAEIGFPDVVDMNGAGTSSATPQIAAAAALYIQSHGSALDRYASPWMRVEAVRRALFASADTRADGGKNEKLGNGVLRAADALDLAPPDAGALVATPADSASFSFLRVLTGLGAAPSGADRMLALEATQLAQRWSAGSVPNPLEAAVPDPDGSIDQIATNWVRDYLEALETHPDASAHLRQRVRTILADVAGSPPPSRRGRGKAASGAPVPVAPAPVQAAPFRAPRPSHRRLRGFAVDPSLSTRLDTAAISETTFKIPWEELEPGPIGEYVDVIDIDPASGCCYEPVDLNSPSLLSQDGLAPGEGTPQFHQQMIYAVCRLTIQNFERALGRRSLWRHGPSPNPKNPRDDSRFVGRLRVYPHALREANAYYSPDKVALLFGYFGADGDAAGQLPGGRVFACLSHDIIAHETTHALLDGMHQRFIVGSNPDTLAFHEAFADIVALFQHFTFGDLLRHEISGTRGSLGAHESLLGELAVQFGRAIGRRGALRSAIGSIDATTGRWKPHRADPAMYRKIEEPHARGAILVAAVFDAFLAIYGRRSADLLRLATGGTGVLRPGAIHPDLAGRLADEAAKAAQHVLTMCIRALDYCPPTDITFGEYLRAIITADHDVVPEDDLNYRVAFVEAFRKRGIFPLDLRTLDVESLMWRPPESEEHPPSAGLESLLDRLRSYATGHTYATSRREVFQLQRAMRRDLHEWLEAHVESGPAGRSDAAFLGLVPGQSFEVNSARFAFRTGPDGNHDPQLLLGLLQRRKVPVFENDRDGETFEFEGGSTVIASLCDRKIRYCIRKSFTSTSRLARQRSMAAAAVGSPRATYFGVSSREREPFAVLHRGVR